jgi:hypothetical protein
MLVRRRPLVFVSSSIRGLEDLRADILDRLDSLGLADGWLFEFHGVAAGSRPSAQYLQHARDCDLFVLVVGDELRSGTIEEYGVAHDDRPNKVLAFLFGEAGPTSEALRETVRLRHRYWSFRDSSVLPDEIGRAVREYLETGEIVRRDLVRDVKDRLDERRRFVGLPANFEFQTTVIDRNGRTLSSSDLTAPAGRFVVGGEPGAGKSDAASRAVAAAAELGTALPIVCSVSSDGQPEDWIATTFDRVKFEPGAKLIAQYLRDGRLALVIDGIDEVGLDIRTSAIRSIADLSRRYPRTPILVPSRLSHPGLPSDFQVAGVDVVAASEFERAIVGGGRPRPAGSQSRRFADLARLPFWAALIARFGYQYRSSPELIDALISERCASLGVDVQRAARLRAALGILARAARPRLAIGIEEALTHLARWLASDGVTHMYGDVSADALLESARRVGFLMPGSDGNLQFPHQLIAAYLAAEQTVRDGELMLVAYDDDYNALVAALANERNVDLCVNALQRVTLLGLSQFLRYGSSRRAGVTSSDLGRLEESFRSLRPMAGLRSIGRLSAIRVNGYLCIGFDDGFPADHQDDLAFDEWVSHADEGRGEVTCWRGDPFIERTPEYLAAWLTLNVFKAEWLSMRPPGSPYAPPGAAGRSLVDDPAFPQRLLEFVLASNRERQRLLAVVGLLGSALDNVTGQPRVVVRRGASQAFYSVEWGAPESTVSIESTEDFLGTSVEHILADPDAAAYHDLESELAAAIGSALFSQAAHAPTEMPWEI